MAVLIYNFCPSFEPGLLWFFAARDDFTGQGRSDALNAPQDNDVITGMEGNDALYSGKGGD